MNYDTNDEPAYMAKLAEQTERFEDMVEFMKKFIEEKRDINEEARNLLSIGNPKNLTRFNPKKSLQKCCRRQAHGLARGEQPGTKRKGKKIEVHRLREVVPETNRKRAPGKMPGSFGPVGKTQFQKE